MATLVKASFLFLCGDALELSNLIELRCHRLSFINRWGNSADVLAIVQLFEHKRFEHSTFDRCKPRSADEQIANRAWQKLGSEPSDAKLKHQLVVANGSHLGEEREHAKHNVLRETLHGMCLCALQSAEQLQVTLASATITTRTMHRLQPVVTSYLAKHLPATTPFFATVNAELDKKNVILWYDSLHGTTADTT